MLRLHLPPNFAAAVARDAVPVRVELDLAAVPAPGLLPALALLKRWCGGTAPPAFLQLSRAQLRDLAAAAGAQPIFVEGGQAGPWRHAALVAAPAAPAATASIGRAAGTEHRKSTAAPLAVDGSEHFLALTLPSREHPRYADALALA
jgi:hypothetical protein